MANTASFTVEGKIVEGTNTQICDRVFANDDNTVTQYLDDQVTVGADVTDQAISLASVGGSAKHILVIFSAGCSIKLQQNTAPAITIAAAGGAMVFINGTITNIYVTNSGSTPITVKRVAAS